MTSPQTMPGPKDWLILATVALVQLIVVLDGTIVAIALPQAQLDLGLTNAARSWAITIYALTFGSLLLLGGLLVSRLGMKRALMIGLVGFAASSAFGGLVRNAGELIAARGLQGIFAALMAPAALAILTTSFSSGPGRNIAFAVFGTCAGVGAAIGLLLGGVLTEFVSWRWTLLINVPIVAAIVIMGSFTLPNSSPITGKRIDFSGVVLIVAGLAALVYGLTLAEHGWTAPETLAFLAIGIILIAAFVVVESRVAAPLLPLRVITDRVRGTAIFVQAIAGAMMIGTMLYLAFHLQLVLGMPPFLAGLATMPQTLATLIVAGFGVQFLDRLGPKPFLVAGLVLTGLALLHLSQVTADGSYATQVLPALIVSGIGMGLVFMPLQNVAMRGVEPADAGVAGAVLNAASQVGGSVGLAIFTSLASLAAAGGNLPSDLVASHAAVFWVSCLLMFGTAIIAAIVLPRGIARQAGSEHAPIALH